VQRFPCNQKILNSSTNVSILGTIRDCNPERDFVEGFMFVTGVIDYSGRCCVSWE
jgi:hypothetical protein